MAIYRTAQGKSLDMSALASRNERTRAVGNMSVNARGDTIDANGKIVETVSKKVGAGYQRSVTNKVATSNRVAEADPIATPISTEESEFLPHELEFEDDQDAEIAEAIKAAENAETPEFVVKPASEAPDFFEPPVKKGRR